MSTIMVLPGTKWQIPLIQRVKSLGHHVLLVNPVRNSGVYELADDLFLSDIFAVDRMEKYAREHRIDAVLSDECDIAIPVVAELGVRLNLPALTREAAALYTNKFLMREFGRKIKLKTVEYCLCYTADMAIDFFHTLGKEIIIKPIDSNASHGVFKVGTEEEIRTYFEKTLSFSRSIRAIIAERYIHGTEFTVDGVKTPNQHYTMAISEKKHYSYNENIANELFFTHTNENFDYDKLKAVNDIFVMNSPLKFGLTHAEYKYENGEFYLIEIGARGGGNMISSVIVPFMSNYDTYDYLINCSLGIISPVNFERKKDCYNRAAVLKFFESPGGGGIVTDIKGEELLKSETVDYALNFSRGDKIANSENDSDRIGYYIACAESKQKLMEKMNRIDEHFRIMVE